MSETVNLLSYNNALSKTDTNNVLKDLAAYQTLHNWVATNASISVVTSPYALPSFYTLKITPTNTANILLRLINQSIPGTNDRPLSEISYLAHGLVSSNVELNLTGELKITSPVSSSVKFSSTNTSTVVDRFNAVRTGSILLKRGKTSQITNAVGTGSAVTFTGFNTFSIGDVIRTHGISPNTYELNGVTVTSATSTTFTVTSTATGTYSTSLSNGYAHIIPETDTGSSPFPRYSGEDVSCDITYTISGHSINSEIYFAFPVLIDELAFQRDWTVRSTNSVMPQVYKDIDATSTPSYPLAKLISALMTNVNDISEIYARLRRYDLSEIPVYADGTERYLYSELVDRESVTATNRRWLGQFTGRRLIDNIYARNFTNGAIATWESSQYDFHQWQLQNRYLGTKSGSLEAVRGTISRYLTGSKFIVFSNQGSFNVKIQTLFAETLGISTDSTVTITAVQDDTNLAGTSDSGYVRFTASNSLAVNDWVSIYCTNSDGTKNDNYSNSAVQVFARDANYFVISYVTSGSITGVTGVAKPLIKVTAVDDGADINGSAIPGYVRYAAVNTFSAGDKVTFAGAANTFDVIDATIVAATGTHFVIASGATGSTTTGYAHASSSPLVLAAVEQTRPMGINYTSQEVLDFSKFTFDSSTTGIIDTSRLG
jgi:hypothetical protein